MSIPAFYTNQQLLPQSQSPEQLSAWLSGKHPGYDLVAWCFYGNLISKAKDSDELTINAVAYITQFAQSATMPHLEGIGVRPFQSGWIYNGENTDGYLLSADQSPFPIPAVTVTSKPWSIVTSYSQDKEWSTNCISLVEGEMGSVGAKYMLTADVLCLTADKETRRLRAEITIVDRMGTVAVGDGPSSFSTVYLTAEQSSVLKNNYDTSLAKYLDKTNTPLTNQGWYYHSAPLLEVQSFKIVGKDGEVLNEGNQGTLWMDYCISSFNKGAKPSASDWTFFAIQFPKKSAALITSIVEYAGSTSSVKMAKFFCTPSQTMSNGVLLARKEWKMKEINIERDEGSRWVSPHSQRMYYMKYTLILGSSDFPASLTLESVRSNQEVYVKNAIAKYEGVFKVTGTVNGEDYSGYAWGEVQNGNVTSHNNRSCTLL